MVVVKLDEAPERVFLRFSLDGTFYSTPRD